MLSDGVVLTFLGGDTHQILKLDFAGNILAQVDLTESGYRVPVLSKNTGESFWFNTHRRLVLLSNDLEVLRDNEKDDTAYFPLSVINSNAFLYTKANVYNDYKIAMIDSAGTLQATLPFPLLKNRNLNLRCIVIDKNKFALLWTEKKDVYCQLFNEKLEPLDEPFLIHLQPEFYQEDAIGCVAGENLFFVWSDSRDFQQGYNIYGKFIPIKDLVSVETRNQGDVVNDFKLEQNYPNPFNSTTTLSFFNSTKISASIKIFNTLGQVIRTWEFSAIEPGSHTVAWNGRDENGTDLSSGVYFCRILAGNRSQQIKVLLLR